MGINIKRLWQKLASESPPIPDTIEELLQRIPPKAIGGIAVYELQNHELEYRVCGNLKLDAFSRYLFKIAYEFARFGMEKENYGQLEEEERA